MPSMSDDDKGFKERVFGGVSILFSGSFLVWFLHYVVGLGIEDFLATPGRMIGIAAFFLFGVSVGYAGSQIFGGALGRFLSGFGILLFSSVLVYLYFYHGSFLSELFWLEDLVATISWISYLFALSTGFLLSSISAKG